MGESILRRAPTGSALNEKLDAELSWADRKLVGGSWSRAMACGSKEKRVDQGEQRSRLVIPIRNGIRIARQCRRFFDAKLLMLPD